MAFTRFKYDDSRTIKSLQQATDPGRWVLNVPGNGADMPYFEDPQLIIQKWGANLHTNTIALENELRCMYRPLSRDCIQAEKQVKSKPIQYPTSKQVITDQSRATNPAWLYRDLEHPWWEYPLLNPQENTCLPFLNNLDTRILEKDAFIPKRECLLEESISQLPTKHFLPRKRINVNQSNCSETNSCKKI
jgi:hypothetical protein